MTKALLVLALAAITQTVTVSPAEPITPDPAIAGDYTPKECEALWAAYFIEIQTNPNATPPDCTP